MISKFFIDHPRFAMVVSIVITIAGVISITALPITQYPDIVPSQVTITANYPGADALTVQQAIVEPIEAQVNGVKDMIYISSTSSDSGSAMITTTFAPGSDGNLNTVNVQNRSNWASAQLPDEVRRQGVVVKERSSNMLLVITLFSPKSTHDALFLSNYASINVVNEISRISGISDVTIIGQLNYSMRIWVDPDKLASMGISIDEITNAVKAQNVQVAAGAIGDSPTGKQQVYRFNVQTQGRLLSVKEFENVVIRQTSEGATVKLSNVARVELGAENYSVDGKLNGSPSALIAVYQFNDANGVNIANACRAKLEELKKLFPPDLEYGIQYDTTKFVKSSIDEVVKTLFEAVLLVILISFIFLQDWRSTTIPTIAIPVSLVGTFAVLLAVGYTINLITLFGLILAIGIVVDDAILVIENVNRLMNEEKCSPRDAAIKTMEQVTGPIIATTLVLLAMFIPTCFLPGITGEMYRQFGVTISVAVLISAVNALTLSPSLSALLLRPERAGHKKWLPFRWFDWGFGKLTGGYTVLVGSLCRKAFIIFVLYLGMTVFSGKLYQQLPSAFMPPEDQGAFFVNVQLPDGASLPRTQKVVAKVTEIIKKTPGVTDVITSAGYSIVNSINATNSAMVIVILDDWSKRLAPELRADAIINSLRGKLFQIPEAMCMPFPPATIPGLGNTGGFSFVVQDTTGTNPQRLADVVNSLIVTANNNPMLTGVFSTFSANVPQVFLKVDREKALKMGVSMQSINDALEGMLGYTYINDFNKFGKVYKVEIQAESQFRSDIAGMSSIYLKNSKGEMVPLDTLIEIDTRFGPQFLNRYNMYSSVTITGSPSPGCSSGQAMKAMEEIAAQKLPAGMKFDWTDLSYQERLAGGKVAIVFVLALAFIYLFLVAQYESWLIPFSVMLSVPIAFLGAICSLMILHLDNNIYTQVGLVLLFGIASKTAILIVEFAKELCERENMSPVDAAIHAAKLRFRAVIMTGVSFILGVLPLVIAEGAGAAGRRSLGTVIFGGMIVACIVGTVLIPTFFVVFQSVINWSKKSGSQNKGETIAQPVPVATESAVTTDK